MRRAKIVCTMGPAVESEDKLREIVQAGMNVARLNLSHGDYSEHKTRYDRVRKISGELNKPIAVLVDLQGPKIRLGRFANGPHDLARGDIFTTTTDEIEGTKERVGTAFKNLPKDCKPGDRILIDDLSFTLPRNGIVGIIGPNGAGKTTLFKTILGMEKPDSGNIKVGETVSISYVDQSRAGIDPKKSLWEVVSDGLDFIKVGQVEMPSRAYVSAFGFKGPDQQKPAGVLSGGERNRLNLALTLKMGGNLLLLDEPTNDLDVETLGSLENALLEFPGRAIVISHDRWFLDRVATHILAYEGDSKWFWFEGNFESYEKNKIDRLGAEAARPHRATYRKLTR